MFLLLLLLLLLGESQQSLLSMLPITVPQHIKHRASSYSMLPEQAGSAVGGSLISTTAATTTATKQVPTIIRTVAYAYLIAGQADSVAKYPWRGPSGGASSSQHSLLLSLAL
jgi:hypothetical protein